MVMVSREVPALVFVNRAAGHGRARTYLPRMRSLFASLHFPAQFVETGSADELESAARCALSPGQRTLLAMGGDGTFQALANGVYGSEAIIGILPTGGGNDLAAALGLRGNVFRVTQEVLKGKPRPVDLVSVRTADGRSRLYAGGAALAWTLKRLFLRTAVIVGFPADSAILPRPFARSGTIVR